MMQLKDSMTDIEKIRQEIERLKKWSESSKKEWIDEGYKQNAFAEDCRIKSFDKLLAFIDSLPEEPDKSLKEAAGVYARLDNEGVWKDGGKYKGFIAGAEWQKEQMLNEAVEGEIQMRYSGCLCAKTIRAINEDKFKLGDKVRIIIVKEEKK